MIAEKLNAAQLTLQRNYGHKSSLVVYDCARPLSVQKAMWAILPDDSWVANPAKGSKHNFGASVDLSFRDASGKVADMGSRFDHFGKESVFSYANISPEARKNRNILRKVMTAAGFLPYENEWWHFDGHPNPRSAFKILDF
jgi:D-alanyl-D-alanine dipeptidase